MPFINAVHTSDHIFTLSSFVFFFLCALIFKLIFKEFSLIMCIYISALYYTFLAAFFFIFSLLEKVYI